MNLSNSVWQGHPSSATHIENGNQHSVGPAIQLEMNAMPKQEDAFVVKDNNNDEK